MTVVDVNTGKFTGSGGNLEETVTKNNLEAAEEIVRQLRLRDIGGIIVVDFIDMVLESNRDLVLRRLVECLGRDRTRHQVAEVTSLGLVQMTRKRIGTGLLEAFSHECEHCKGRGVVVHDHPVEPGGRADDDEPRGRRSRGGRNRGGRGGNGNADGGNGGNGGQRRQRRRERTPRRLRPTWPRSTAAGEGATTPTTRPRRTRPRPRPHDLGGVRRAVRAVGPRDAVEHPARAAARCRSSERRRRGRRLRERLRRRRRRCRTGVSRRMRPGTPEPTPEPARR